MAKRQNEIVYREMQPGDLIEIPRGNYSHWAVAVGNGDLVHLWGDNDGMGDMTNPSNVGLAASGLNLDKARVCRNDFWEVVGKSTAKINNSKDRKHSPLSVQEIIENALRSIGEEGYNLLWKNCEHFASWCRYGIAWSEQVETALNLAAVGTAIAAGVGILYHVTRSQKNKH